MKEYFFAYGTWRKNFDWPLKERITKDLNYIGKGKIAGRFYDLGEHPGAIKDRKGEIIGDVFLVSNAEKIFHFLDEYEGDGYERKKAKVTLRSGDLITAWVYWYKGIIKEEQRIFCKDYLNYLKHKRTS